jgi:hypothetical protein
MTAIFAQQTPDENLKPGWNVQGTGVGQGAIEGASGSGVPGAGYSEPGVVPATAPLSGPLQSQAGVPFPPGALNQSFIGGEASGSYFQSVLSDPGYANAGNNLLATPVTVLEANLVTAGNQNPFGVAAICNVLSGATASTAQIAPFIATGVANAVFGSAVDLTASAGTEVIVPPAGFIKFGADADVTSITWTPVN